MFYCHRDASVVSYELRSLVLSTNLTSLSASDDNMLKNLEMFDKLSLRFSHRVLFIKDVTATNEICMWTFYGRGQKVAEVCCTSIVYATDKKHTKVRQRAGESVKCSVTRYCGKGSKSPDN